MRSSVFIQACGKDLHFLVRLLGDHIICTWGGPKSFHHLPCPESLVVQTGEEAGPDLVHAWDEPPAGFQENDDSHEPGGLEQDTHAAPSAPKHWTCQVRYSHASWDVEKQKINL